MKLVLDYLATNEARFVKELREYVRFPSVSAQPQHRGDVEACAKWLVAHCKSIGMEAELCATAGNPIVLARTPRGAHRWIDRAERATALRGPVGASPALSNP